MLKQKIQEYKEKFNEKHRKIKSMKIYSSHVPINTVIKIIGDKLPKGIKGSAIAVYFALEGHANNLSEVSASQQTIANEVGYSREYVNYILGQLHSIGIIEKIRIGLTQFNKYILKVRKEVLEMLAELSQLEREEALEEKKQQQQPKPNYQNKKYGKKNPSDSPFHNFDQRNYNFDKLEKALLGWEEVDEEDGFALE